MNRWDLFSIPPSSKKRTPGEPRGAPREASGDRQMPRVLFSTPECRAIIIDLQSGEAMGEHHVRERAVVQVVTGCASVEVSGEGIECRAGTLLVFEPHERHAVQALQDTRLLVILTPWPAPEHYTESEHSHAGRLPPNAVAPPVGTDAEPSIESSSRP